MISPASEWKSLRIWAFEDASKRLDEILNAALTAPQTIERDGRRFVVSLAAAPTKEDVSLLLKGGPLDGDEDLNG